MDYHNYMIYCSILCSYYDDDFVIITMAPPGGKKNHNFVYIVASSYQWRPLVVQLTIVKFMSYLISVQLEDHSASIRYISVI